ncbi:MAG TPA: hypothetical protein VMF58_08880 [Rhizomicrobium sp.]|nr:hypothetical protein [Rhizomicrobium sp.]
MQRAHEIPEDAGLAYWKSATLARIGDDAAARLTNDPRYDDVLRRIVSEVLAFYDAEPKLNAAFQEIGTIGLALFALYLDSKGGITHRRLTELSNTSTVMSRGRASAILGLLRYKGLARPEKAAPNGVQFHYLPSPELVRFFTRRIGLEYEALTLVEPAIRAFSDRWQSPGMLECFITNFGADLVRAGQEPLSELESIAGITRRRAGFQILCHLLMLADRGHAFPSLAPFEINVSEIARRFFVARPQVRRIVSELEKENFLARDGETFQFQPLLQSKFRRFMATIHVALMACAHDILKAQG